MCSNETTLFPIHNDQRVSHIISNNVLHGTRAVTEQQALNGPKITSLKYLIDKHMSFCIMTVNVLYWCKTRKLMDSMLMCL